MEMFGSKCGSRRLWHNSENCDAEFRLRDHQSALSLNGTEIWLPSYKQKFLRRMDIRRETDPEEEGAEPLAGPVGEAESC